MTIIFDALTDSKMVMGAITGTLDEADEMRMLAGSFTPGLLLFSAPGRGAMRVPLPAYCVCVCACVFACVWCVCVVMNRAELRGEIMRMF